MVETFKPTCPRPLPPYSYIHPHRSIISHINSTPSYPYLSPFKLLSLQLSPHSHFSTLYSSCPVKSAMQFIISCPIHTPQSSAISSSILTDFTCPIFSFSTVQLRRLFLYHYQSGLLFRLKRYLLRISVDLGQS